ncbi:MAG: shikimate dehydrogenase [Bacteroidota bacterium]
MSDSTTHPIEYGLIGKKLSHSFSKKYFTRKFQREGIPSAYELYELEEADELPALLAQQPQLKGINVTIPFKKKVLKYLDELSHDAKSIGAVNTIKVGPGPRLVGYNTDCYGFEESLRGFLGGQSIDRALVLGTGGAAQAIIYVLEEWDIDYRMVSRNPSESNQISYSEVYDLDLTLIPLLINTTPLGMYPVVDQAPDLPYEDLGSDHFVYDLVYNPEETELMKRAATQGAKTCNGLRMLELQAEKAWEIWQGR